MTVSLHVASNGLGGGGGGALDLPLHMMQRTHQAQSLLLSP